MWNNGFSRMTNCGLHDVTSQTWLFSITMILCCFRRVIDTSKHREVISKRIIKPTNTKSYDVQVADYNKNAWTSKQRESVIVWRKHIEIEKRMDQDSEGSQVATKDSRLRGSPLSVRVSIFYQVIFWVCCIHGTHVDWLIFLDLARKQLRLWWVIGRRVLIWKLKSGS